MRTSCLLALLGLALAGCSTIEGGYRYEYDGRIVKADGKTPIKGLAVRVSRPEPPPPPDLPLKYAKSAVKYIDHSNKAKTDKAGLYLGTLETVKGWKYTQFMGMHTSGPTKPPEPPVLDEVILYVQEKGSGWMGYTMKIPPEAQKDAISGIRKVHVPDLLLPNKPAATQSSE